MGPYPYLTVLIPVYNEEKNIASTVKIISDKLVSLNCTFEILIVDDCSTDQTLNIIKKLMVSNLAIRLYHQAKDVMGTFFLAYLHNMHEEVYEVVEFLC